MWEGRPHSASTGPKWPGAPSVGNRTIVMGVGTSRTLGVQGAIVLGVILRIWTKKTLKLNHFVNAYLSYQCLSMDEVFLNIDRFSWFWGKKPKFRRQFATPKSILILKFCHHCNQHRRNNGNSLVHAWISNFVSKWRTLTVLCTSRALSSMRKSYFRSGNIFCSEPGSGPPLHFTRIRSRQK